MDEKKNKPDQATPEAAPPLVISAAELEALCKRAAEADEFREQMLRARADYANLVKRQAKTMDDFRLYALQDFVLALLPGLDDLRNFLRLAPAGGDSEALRKGVELGVEKLLKALRDAGVRPVPTAVRPFDPAFHEAVLTETDPEAEVATVIEEVRAGHTLGDRVIRPAQVRVAMPPEKRSAGRGQRSEGEGEKGPHADV